MVNFMIKLVCIEIKTIMINKEENNINNVMKKIEITREN
jgi:hypothetical protein